MKVESVGSNPEINCPKCGLAWVHGDDGVVEDTKCPHLRFVISPEGMEYYYYFNGMTQERLVSAVEAAYRSGNPAAEDVPPEEAEDTWHEAMRDHGFWAAATMDEADVIFDYTEDGLACGPVKYTVLFGAKLDD